MSLEFNINDLIEHMRNPELLDESLSQAKKLYVETGKMSPMQLKRLYAKDPTKDKSGKYIQWMAKMFVSGHTRNSRAFDIVKEFDDLVKKNKIQNKNIDSYESLETVTDAVHQAHMMMGEETRATKEKEARKALVAMNGSVENAYKYVNKKFYTKQEDGDYVLREDPGYIPKEVIQSMRDQMLSEESGQEWRRFTIDDLIFDKLKPEDVVFDNKYVTIVEAKSKAMAQFYGRNMWYTPGSNQRTSFWCVAYSGEHEGCYWDSMAYYDTAFVEGDETRTSRKSDYHRFYIVLPKDIGTVDKKEHAKLIIQAKEGEKREVWDTNDRQMSDGDIESVFNSWSIPWEGKQRRRGEEG